LDLLHECGELPVGVWFNCMDAKVKFVKKIMTKSNSL
jgi:hypothetical protein